MSIEIERKFLLPRFSKEQMNKKNIKLINKKKISQNYLAIGEEEIRIRKIIDESEENASYFMTYKKGNSLKRIEQEIEILKETYDQLQGNLKPINKTRSTFKFNNYVSSPYSVMFTQFWQ